MKSMAVRAAVVAVAVVSGACGSTPGPPALQAGTALARPRPLGALALQDVAGRRFDRSRFTGRWSLVVTGFSRCPDFCPATLALLQALRRRVPEPRVQFVFVSVDPARDTPDVLRRYVANFGAGIVATTGAADELARFTRELGLAQVVVPGTGGDYTLDHSTALVLVDPEARVAGYFRAPHDLESIAADLAAL
ncbi:MAG: SCO family protein [Steroidobacteraceae bacterium]|jgi:protein SCO1/2|nr:SCO family protein [Steroidobacteraceae bacterium]